MTHADLIALLERCLPIVEHDAGMMADLTRHAPLDFENQTTHDSTEYESEKLVREIPAMLSILKSGEVVLCGRSLTPAQVHAGVTHTSAPWSHQGLWEAMLDAVKET